MVITVASRQKAEEEESSHYTQYAHIFCVSGHLVCCFNVNEMGHWVPLQYK